MLLRTIIQRVRPSGEHANHLRGSINSCVRKREKGFSQGERERKKGEQKGSDASGHQNTHQRLDRPMMQWRCRSLERSLKNSDVVDSGVER